MKRLLLSISAVLSICNSFAQTVPNGGFENWYNNIYFEEPNFGLTSNLQSYFSIESGNVSKTTDAFAGNYAAKLTTVAAPNDTLQGIIVIGTPNGSTINGGIPINVRPDSLKCHAKFNIQPNDTASIIVGFRKLGFVDPIGFAQINFTGNQNSYQEYKAFITWFDATTVPDTLFGYFVSSNVNQYPSIPGSEIYIDNVGFTGAVGAPNTDFETWTTVQSIEPENWWTPNFALINQMPCVTQSTDAHSGQYALRIENVLSLNGDTIGFASNGYFINEDFAGGMAVTQNPTKVTGYYKYTPAGNDTALVGIFITKFDATFGYSVRLDSSLVKLPAAANYTYFEAPLFYNGWPTADSLNITFASGNFQGDTSLLVVGSVLLVDDIEVLYNPVSVEEFSFQKPALVYPNPAKDILFIKMLDQAANQVFKIFDAKGSLVFEGNCQLQDGMIASINISEMPNGLYFYQINNGKAAISGKLTIQK
jgi:hypothetical protein